MIKIKFSSNANRSFLLKLSTHTISKLRIEIHICCVMETKEDAFWEILLLYTLHLTQMVSLSALIFLNWKTLILSQHGDGTDQNISNINVCLPQKDPTAVHSC